MGVQKLNSVEKWFDELQVIKGIDLEIIDGEFIILVGPSGCGKSTLLRMIGGLEETSRGSIVLDGNDVTANLHQNVAYLWFFSHMPFILT